VVAMLVVAMLVVAEANRHFINLIFRD
jgi:hypothetical protein